MSDTQVACYWHEVAEDTEATETGVAVWSEEFPFLTKQQTWQDIKMDIIKKEPWRLKQIVVIFIGIFRAK